MALKELYATSSEQGHVFAMAYNGRSWIPSAAKQFLPPHSPSLATTNAFFYVDAEEAGSYGRVAKIKRLGEKIKSAFSVHLADPSGMYASKFLVHSIISFIEGADPER
jgi:hypothetical protein